ncbi:putative helicase mov-10-B.1 [Nymphon striatum]|nr:putative helicase mov-10-B.1 [Nymphon striatum]
MVSFSYKNDLIIRNSEDLLEKRDLNKTIHKRQRTETRAYNQKIVENTIKEGKGYKMAKKRLAIVLDANQPREQAGFRSGFSTMNHIHTVNQVIEKYHGYNLPLCLAFIDYKKAFDSVEAVLNALSAQNISPAYIRMLDQIFGLGTSNIKLHTNTNKIRLEKGISQFRFYERYTKEMRFNVRFTFQRYPLVKMHEALDFYPDVKHILFPKASTNTSKNVNSDDVKFYNKDIKNNPEQKQAVENIVNGSSKPIPFLLFGPPGTGKTVTVVEAIKQVWFRNKRKAILVCAPSNSAADLLATKLLEHIPSTQMFRLNALSRIWKSIPNSVQKCSNYNGSEFYFPDGDDLQQYRIIISTVVTAGRLLSSGLVQGHFHYVFVDEAGHCMEPEVLIAFAGLMNFSERVSKSGLLVLAGDPKQLGPVLTNEVVIKKGLGISFLQRLMENYEFYLSKDGKFDPKYVCKLLQNYRSNQHILQLPNELFYDNELKCCGNEVLINSLCDWPYLKRKGFPILFHSVIGQNVRENTSPSYFNVEEIDVVIDYVRKLLQPKVLKPKNIGIISPYSKQFQGQERQIIIISTVRSDPDLIAMDYEHQIGFLKNPKRFNVAITRAQALLIIVGNPFILKKDFHWSQMINYCDKNNSYIGTSLKNEDILEHCANFGLIEENVAGALCISLQTSREKPEWRWGKNSKDPAIPIYNVVIY